MHCSAYPVSCMREPTSDARLLSHLQVDGLEKQSAIATLVFRGSFECNLDVVGPALTGPHLLTLWLWVILRVLETVDAHSGYEFPWSPSNFLPLYGGCVVTVYLVVCSFVDAFEFSWCLLIEIWLFPAVLISMTTTIACFIRSQGTTHRPLSTWTGVVRHRQRLSEAEGSGGRGRKQREAVKRVYPPPTSSITR
ncbi:hypothetical protein GW17_00030408 [Ensete ventricosum]|nr:hypothetical protein GW17_00030408 [Ensete ventricosum]